MMSVLKGFSRSLPYPSGRSSTTHRSSRPVSETMSSICSASIRPPSQKRPDAGRCWGFRARGLARESISLCMYQAAAHPIPTETMHTSVRRRVWDSDAELDSGLGAAFRSWVHSGANAKFPERLPGRTQCRSLWRLRGFS